MLLKQMSESTFALWCPGCDDLHVVDETWEYNGSPRFPTFHPSVYVWGENSVCHFFVNSGKLLFLPDCTHELAEQTVNMEELPSWMVEEPEEEEKAPRDRFYYPSLGDVESEEPSDELPEADFDIIEDDFEPDEPDFDLEDEEIDDFYPENAENGRQRDLNTLFGGFGND